MKVEGIVLAAGFSSRAGDFKLTWPLDGTTLIEQTILGMYDFCDRVIVVGGYRIEELAFLPNKYEKIHLVCNKDYERGMFSSVQVGVRNLEGDLFFLIPGDSPLVNKDVYRVLLQEEGDILIPGYRGRKGHPVLIRSALGTEILNEPGKSSLREFTRRKGYKVVEVEDRGILVDIDTRKDYENINRGV